MLTNSRLSKTIVNPTFLLPNMTAMLLIICLIAATYGLQASAAEANDEASKTPVTISLCSGKDGVMVAMPGSCSGFFFCVDGNAIASSCGSFYHFNADLAICDHPLNARCQENDPTILEASTDIEANDICAKASPGFSFGKKQSCSLYYVCYQKYAVRRVCQPQKHFNLIERKCMDIDKAQCSYTIPLPMNATAAKVTKKPNQLMALPTGSVPMSTAPAKGPTNVAGHRQPPLNIKRTRDLSVLCSVFKSNRTLPHPYDCSRFIYCLQGKAHTMACPKGLHFSSKSLRCEWPYNANCQANVK
ncbi:probable chitinase 10 [Musca domestica]|uniref:Probable chitinase 10 n=1 Tax=Musca domestica TaxID=7370 RepID=A0ABM3VHP7_MUSDO|nr:probable chitinase 10 [Musca domestica]